MTRDAIPVLFVAPELVPWKVNGITTVVQKLANALAASGGAKITILGTAPGECRPGPPDYHEGVDFLLVKKPTAPEPWHHLQLQVAYRRAVRLWLQRNNRGLVHFHILPGARGLLAAAAALRSSCSVVLSIYDWPPLEVQYYAQPLGHRGHWWLARLLFGRFPQFVANSRYIAEAVRKLYPRSNIAVIPNGICPEEWDLRGETPGLEGTPRLLHWGMLWRKKGVNLLLEAFRLLRQRGKPQARLYIAGDGEDREFLQGKAVALGLDQSVQFLGKVDHPTLVGLLKGCDIAVFPSAYEGFGLAILEAMACGKAVVTTALGGPREFISHGEDGIVVEERNARSIAQVLEDLSNRAQFLQELGGNARETALRYTWSAIAPKYLSLYEHLRADVVR